MKSFQYNKLLIVLIIAGLIASLAIDFQRHEVEVANNTIELVMDYEDVVELAQREGMATEDVMAQVKEAGITSLAVYETTFKKFNVNGKATAVNGSQLLANYYSGAMTDTNWRQLVESGQVKGTYIYVSSRDSKIFQEVHEDLLRRLGSDRVKLLNVSGQNILEVKDSF